MEIVNKIALYIFFYDLSAIGMRTVVFSHSKIRANSHYSTFRWICWGYLFVSVSISPKYLDFKLDFPLSFCVLASFFISFSWCSILILVLFYTSSIIITSISFTFVTVHLCEHFRLNAMRNI